NQVRVVFNERINPSSFTTADVVAFSGPLGDVSVTEIVAVDGTSGREFDIRFPSQAALGNYQLTLGPDIEDVFGNTMHSSGGAAELAFTIIPDTVGPRITRVLPDEATDQPTDRVRVSFDEPIRVESFTISDVAAFSGPGGEIQVTAIESLSPSEFEIVFPMQDALGTYTLIILSDIQDIAGNTLDQDQDGEQGELVDDSLDVSFDLERWLYADSVIDFSSQYTTTVWSAAQALGEPDTFQYGDLETAWAPRSENGTTEFLTLGFAEPLLANGVVIRETFGNGFVRKIELRNETTGQFEVIAEPFDDSAPGSPVDFAVRWPQTTYGVDAVRITVDTDHNQNAFEEIDSVQLRGVSVPDLDGARVLSSSVSGSTQGPIDRIELTFDEPLADGTFTLEDVTVISGPNGPVAVNAVNRLTSTRYEVAFEPQSSFGDYFLSIGPDVLDLQGLPMNQDRDEFNGETQDDAFPIAFRIEQWQFADSVIDFSSQFGSDSWSAAQALGPSDSPIYGDQRTAWAPGNINGTTEFISVGFDDPILSSGVMVRQTFGNGFVRAIDVRDAEQGTWVSMPIPIDTSEPGQPAEYTATWPLTSFTADAVRVEIDTDQTLNYEEIDSIQLRGVPAPDLVGPSVIGSTPDSGHPGPLEEIDLFFSEAVEDGTFTLQDVQSFEGPSGPITVDAVDRLAEDHYRLSFASQVERGTYLLSIGSQIFDAAGNPMDLPFKLSFDIELWQHASSVIDVSSQYSGTSWSAEQALGAPDTLSYGDARTAWAPASANGTTETLTVGFETAVQSSGVIIRQTYGNGFVRQVEVRDAVSGEFETVSTALDGSLSGTPVDYLVTWPQTDYAVDAVRVSIDTNHSSSFEEIDAVTLIGVVPPDVTGPRVIATEPEQGSAGPVDHVLITFDEPIAASTFDLSDVSELTTPSGAIPIDSVSQVSDRQYRVNFAEQSEWGTYSLSIGPEIEDLAGNSMDQDDDGQSGEPVDDVFELVFDLELWQYATSVVDFSSQYSATSWSAAQALGEPDTLTYGDSRNAWAPARVNGGIETITLGFDTPVLSSGAIIRQTFGNGFVRQVDARDSETGQFTRVFDGVDDSLPGTPVDFLVSWPMTSFAVDALRIFIDTTQSFSYEEIDAVQLRGVVAPDLSGPRVITTSPAITAAAPLDRIEVTFNEPVDLASIDVSTAVQLVGPQGAVAIDSVTSIDDQTIALGFTAQNDFGSYQLTVGPGIKDLAGNLMNQDGDAFNGEAIEDVHQGQFDLQLLQYASTVVDFSSQYSPFGWSASAALGAPDTFAYGDARTAWAPRYANSGLETLTLGFETSVLSTGATIRQTFGNGFVRQVELRDAATGIFHSMTIGADNSEPGTPVDFEVTWAQTAFAVDAIRITIDTAHTFGYEEIDAVMLHGITPSP
ncbi:MAG: Ig-like domain-containing protein, partial [Planctomycetota bacterium]